MGCRVDSDDSKIAAKFISRKIVEETNLVNDSKPQNYSDFGSTVEELLSYGSVAGNTHHGQGWRSLDLEAYDDRLARGFDVIEPVDTPNARPKHTGSSDQGGDTVDDEKLSAFTDFVDTLDLDDLEEGD